MSDSHGRDDIVERIIGANADCDYYFHLGDLCSDSCKFSQLTLIRGNNDFDIQLPEHIISSFNGINILFTHSHKYYCAPYNEKLINLAKRNNCQLVFYGHTHMIDDQYIENIRFLNPGSLCYNRDLTQIGYIVLEIDNKGNYSIIRKYIK